MNTVLNDFTLWLLVWGLLVGVSSHFGLENWPSGLHKVPPGRTFSKRIQLQKVDVKFKGWIGFHIGFLIYLGFEENLENNWSTNENDDDQFGKDQEGEYDVVASNPVEDPIETPEPIVEVSTATASAAAVDLAASGNDSAIGGHVNFLPTSEGPGVRIQGEIYGLEPGQHGFHIHTKATVENGCLAAEGHFNPFNVSVRKPKRSKRLQSSW